MFACLHNVKKIELLYIFLIDAYAKYNHMKKLYLHGRVVARLLSYASSQNIAFACSLCVCTSHLSLSSLFL